MATALQPGVTTSVSTADAVPDTSRPDTQSPAYLRMLARSKKCRDLMIGLEAIRAGGEDYLGKFDQESDDSYELRQNLAALSNGFARTVLASVGMLLQQPPELGDDMPAQLKDLAENIDLAGTHLDVFAWNLFLWAIIDGRAGILVDYQRATDPGVDRSKASHAATLAIAEGKELDASDERALGLRPYWVLFQSPDIFLALRESVNGTQVLTLLVLREAVSRRVGRFGVAPVTKFRVYARTGNAITFEVWETTPGDPTGVLHEIEKPTPMRNVSEIPFSLFVAGQTIAPGEVKPCLLDLAELNIEHHQIKTDIRHLEMLACVPTIVRIGAQKDEDGNYPEVVLGPRSTLEAPQMNGVAEPIYWLTPPIDVLEPAMKTLANNEAAQGAAGLAFLAPETRAAETAEAKRIDAGAQNATLATVGRRGQDALEAAFGFTGQFIGLKSGSVTINTDFENTVMDAAMVSALGALAANGKLDLETLLTLLEGGRVLPDGTDKAAIIKRILLENARLDVSPEPDPKAKTDSELPE